MNSTKLIMFKKIKQLKPFKQAIFTLVVAFSVVLFWKGAWGIADTYIFPNNYELSSWFSIILGLIILYFTHHYTRELI